MRATALSNRGAAHVRLGQHDLALADFDAALQVDYDNVQAYQNRGGAYLSLDQYENAIKDFDQAIKLNSRWALAYKCRCDARAQWGHELDKALEDCDKYMRLNPGVAAYATRGFLYLRLGRDSDAIADFDTALEKNPKLSWSLYGRGIAKLRRGNAAEGNADITAANAINAKIAKTFADMGLIP